MDIDSTEQDGTSSPGYRIVDEEKRWKYVEHIRRTPGPYTDPDAVSQEAVDQFDKMKILVIGAGGLGCEMLKDLALSKFRDIHVIDMDTIDISNLNRQFLFREADVGKFKAEAAAKFDKDDDFYKQFQMVICGLDNIEARRWINAKLVALAEEGDGPDCIKPLIDGGTEGFKGQVRPEHCVEWAHIIAWEEEKPFPDLDKDDPEHVTWIYQKALERAKQFNITGITYSFTQGVIKNIIPAIASTNAVIAAACCNEAFKLATGAAPALGMEENYMMYSGDDSIYTYTFKHERKDDCPVCNSGARPLQVNPDILLRDLVESFALRPEAQLKKPSLRLEGKTLYMQFPQAWRSRRGPTSTAL
ncbi:unnamed protein product [Parascedosporium putredinis]|uniref:NEDD8-activating enzyme E1 catalytic subunit n=1 Tax=Parascedosporium putredinis TaxID=1442378 RepID=A0A9P1H409_9PEZI|nr:unnamed protein product [Parascedosporium putredinis]CAI7997776.1 unnamed protein product [Parascedosporium putredinis]